MKRNHRHAFTRRPITLPLRQTGDCRSLAGSPPRGCPAPAGPGRIRGALSRVVAGVARGKSVKVG
jgi:hypothetical protein